MPLKDYRSLIFWWGQRLAWPQVVLYRKFLSAGFTTQSPSFENRMSFGSKKRSPKITLDLMFKVDERTPQKIGPVLPAAAFFFLQHRTFFVNPWTGDDYHSQIIRNHKDKCLLGIAGASFWGVFGRWKMKTWNRFPGRRFWLKMFKQSKALH